MSEQQQLLLRDIDCERYVLAAFMDRWRDLLAERLLITEDCFYDDFHRAVYRAILALDAECKNPDILQVRAKMKSMGVVFEEYQLADIGAATVYESLGNYVGHLFELAVRRGAIREVGDRLTRNAYQEADDIDDLVEWAIDRLSGIYKQGDGEVATLCKGIEQVYDQINRNLQEEHGLTGTPTGFPGFDDKSGGLQKSDLIIIAGETSNGKTSLAVSMMRSAALSGAKVAMYSMEMKKEQIAARMMAMESGVPANEILYSRLDEGKLQILEEGVNKIAGLPIYFDDNSTSNIDTILASIRFLKMRYDIDGAVVDYLQILNVNMRGANKEQQMGDVSRRLKNLAKDLDIWIIALSQLNRDSQNPVPTLARLRDSGQIAEAADTVILLYRPEIKGVGYKEPFVNVSTLGTALFDVAKGRNIGLTKFIVGFNAPTTKFYHLLRVPLVSEEERRHQEEDNPF